jgi:hypothetical protein
MYLKNTACTYKQKIVIPSFGIFGKITKIEKHTTKQRLRIDSCNNTILQLNHRLLKKYPFYEAWLLSK